MFLSQLVEPLVLSLLYLAVFYKAGFRGAFLALAAAPVIYAGLEVIYLNLAMAGIVDPPLELGSDEAFVLRYFFLIALKWLPLAFLIFKSWPALAHRQGGAA
jgi:hypothetical protein